MVFAGRWLFARYLNLLPTIPGEFKSPHVVGVFVIITFATKHNNAMSERVVNHGKVFAGFWQFASRLKRCGAINPVSKTLTAGWRLVKLCDFCWTGASECCKENNRERSGSVHDRLPQFLSDKHQSVYSQERSQRT